MTDHTFRFAAQLSKGPEGSAASWAEQARRVEDLGYSALLMPDHFGDQLAPVAGTGRQVATGVVRGVARALRVGDLVDQDLERPSELGAAMPPRVHLRAPAQHLCPTLLLLRRDSVAELLGARARSGRVREHVHAADPGLRDGVQRALERRLVLGREADDHVGREVDVRRGTP